MEGERQAGNPSMMCEDFFNFNGWYLWEVWLDQVEMAEEACVFKQSWKRWLMFCNYVFRRLFHTIYIWSGLQLGLCVMTIYIVWRYKNVYRFILCSIVYLVSSQTTVFTVIFFVIWTTCYVLPYATWRQHKLTRRRVNGQCFPAAPHNKAARH